VFSVVACALVSVAACGGEDETMAMSPNLSAATVLDLKHVKTNPTAYNWFDFRPNVKKLILSGQAETEHVAILWYTVADGSVGLHYHAKTESVYVIDGTQTDAKGVYGTETVYFNPPGSGHEIMKSSGFFVLAYAAPPDFANTSLIGEYTPIRIDTNAPDLTSQYLFEPKGEGARAYVPPLDSAGGLSAQLVEITSSRSYPFKGNYVLVLEGTCNFEGTHLGEDTLVVASTVMPLTYQVSALPNQTCLAMGVSFPDPSR
jgi:hypothetical protein